jgi:hypothetical protein
VKANTTNERAGYLFVHGTLAEAALLPDGVEPLGVLGRDLGREPVTTEELGDRGVSVEGDESVGVVRR